MTNDLDLLKQLAPRDATVLDAARREEDLEKILATPRTGASTAGSGGGIPRRAVIGGLAAAGAASILVVGSPLLPGGKPAAAFAATPPVLDGCLAEGGPATQALTSAAASAVRSTLTGSLGSRYSTWSLFTRVVNDQPVRSAVVPQDVNFSLVEDGSGQRTVRIGTPEVPVGSEVSDFDLPTPGTVIRDEKYGPGQTPRVYAGALSAEASTLWDQLSQAHPISELGTGELFVAITDLYKEQVPDPAVRAQLLRLLASRTDILDLGTLRDRTGRAGLAVGVSSSQPGGLPARFVMVFDPASGALLSYEQILTSSPGKLDVKIPSVIDYALFR
ncbi:hypothetical protein [Terrabacter sp. Ter38]|uniref:hypothetical protein n=1 Tax=Terrabacter sp. Ter38 TaxID=2926030 RepID=UPI00211953A9|nr:hypothetical protein [Terrabacter sp. Ter38]